MAKNGVNGIHVSGKLSGGTPCTCLSRYSLEKLCFTVFITLFNFQNFGHKLPAKIQLFTLKISQKTSYWEVMEQTKLNLKTI